MVGLPRKFPSPEKDGEFEEDDIEDASCEEELVVSGIPFVPNKVVVSSLFCIIVSYFMGS